MITLADLRCAYGDKTVLDIPAATMMPGVHGIVGLNGAGKTTFLNALYGFGRNAESRVRWNDADMGHGNTAFLEADNYFHPGITGREYLELFMSGPAAADVRMLNELLEVPLDALITTYSTGMKRKLALLGVLSLDREVVLLDEPMNGLDLASVRVLEAIIKRLAERGRTVLITSHVLGPLITLCDRIHLLQHGRFTQVFERGSTEGLEAGLFAELDRRTDEVVARWGG
ncbi:MAG TPA: ATP-binding cassette domain-containing protein [Flavobacteriales bacterium]|nr:ATP-binding cassette domain-containing protein [Flavobacteriales bacterium]HMR26767.1 ATP-binding cassette domain-containing protein [Flavobacteriales bacterium]